MKDDPIVAEVRKNRNILAEKSGFDLRKLVSEAKSREQTSGHRLVTFHSTRAGESLTVASAKTGQ